MKMKKKECKNGKTLEKTNTFKSIVCEKSIRCDAEKLIALSQTYLQDLTSTISPVDYEKAPHEFIELINCHLAFTVSKVLIALYSGVCHLDSIKNHFHRMLELNLEYDLKEQKEKSH